MAAPITSSSYTGDGVTTTYIITFPRLRNIHVVVTVAGVTKTLGVDFTITGNNLTFNVAPANGAAILFNRVTPVGNDGLIVNFTDGSSLEQIDLNALALQVFYIAQENYNNVQLATSAVQRSGDTMTGSLAMSGNKITGIGNPTNPQDAATKNYVDTSAVSVSGDTMTGPLALSGNKITSVGTPTTAGDATNKSYVDSLFIASGNLPPVTGADNTALLQVVGSSWVTRTPSQVKSTLAISFPDVAGTATLAQIPPIPNSQFLTAPANTVKGALVTGTAVDLTPSQLTTVITQAGTANQYLTSSGWSTLPVKLGAVRVQSFPTSGTYTPNANLVYCVVEMVGAGGGGAGGAAYGGGGGAGEYARGVFSAATIGTSKAVLLGSGGAGGNSANGGNGGATTFGTTLLTAFGGAGGLTGPSSGAHGGDGGAGGSGGDYHSPGQNGRSALAGSPYMGGDGGSGPFGSGGKGVNNNANAGQSNPRGFGAGGSGSCGNGTGNVVAGTGGYVVITEFCSQ